MNLIALYCYLLNDTRDAPFHSSNQPTDTSAASKHQPSSPASSGPR